MRDVLFRGKNFVSDEWIEGGVVHQTDWYGDKVDWWSIIDGTTTDDEIGEAYRVKPETVGQYINKEDKYNRKIFDGDIVKTQYGRLCRVVWFSSRCELCWDLLPIESKHRCPDKHNIWASEHLEVVGNVFDNPEMLEVISSGD